MSNSNSEFFPWQFIPKTCLLALALVAGGCTSDSDDDSSEGYLQFYNGSKNAPAIFLTIDENLEDDDDDDIEITYGSVSYANAGSRKTIERGDYFYELAWQDEDSSARNDLAIINEGQISIVKDSIQFVVLSDNIATPQVQLYDIPLIDDDDDDLNDLFNLRFLNLSDSSHTLDIYYSKSDETFNEAERFGEIVDDQLSDNVKLAQDQYIFYITYAGENTILYQSGEVDYAYASQYVMVIRDNTGTGTSQFALDRVTSSSTQEYLDYNAQAQFRVYNGIEQHALLPTYVEKVDVHIAGVDETPEFSELTQGDMSTNHVLENGDYSVDVIASGSSDILLKNHLLTLPENANKTLFLYLSEENVDHDGDGDVDEDGDGLVDEIEVEVNTLVIDNSLSESIYDHTMTMVNLIDDEDFRVINFYFVRQDETIESAEYSRSVGFASGESITLRNNTYQVYVVAQQESSSLLLASMELTLNEASTGLYLIAETDELSATGYKLTEIEQLEIN